MNQIIAKEQYSENVFKFVVKAPLIARARKAGNFVIVRASREGERIPLTIAEADPREGTITIVAQKVGVSSNKLCLLQPGDYLEDVVGPLGKPTDIHCYGTVVCAGGGVGVDVRYALPPRRVGRSFTQSDHYGRPRSPEFGRSHHHDRRRKLWPEGSCHPRYRANHSA